MALISIKTWLISSIEVRKDNDKSIKKKQLVIISDDEEDVVNNGLKEDDEDDGVNNGLKEDDVHNGEISSMEYILHQRCY